MTEERYKLLNLNVPKDGMPRGVVHGMIVTAILLAVLFVVLFVMDAAPGTTQAIYADLIMALTLAVAGVWVVGGLVEISSTIWDVTLKATGGVAIILFVAIYVRPIYHANGAARHAESATLPAWGTMEQILSGYEADFHAGKPGAIRISLPEAQREKILNFHPAPPDVPVILTGDWNLLRTVSPKADLLNKVGQRQSCLSFEERDGVYVAILK
ncbi:hypothetical protein [Antarctobacter jejuensis]|uniref:hypothetical protein n=1 Tax=Antarctobacter jejuensis TaxID=1439938 RepID=UPI003FD4A26B